VEYERTLLGNAKVVSFLHDTQIDYDRDARERVTKRSVSGPEAPGFVTRETFYDRDDAGRVTTVRHADGSFETFTYNIYGQILQHRMRNGGVETFAYDGTGRRTSHVSPTGSSALAPGNVTRQFTYDSRDLVQTETLLVPGGVNRVTQYAYNNRGQVTRVTFPDLTFVSFEYDTYGNQTARVDELGHRWTAAYDEFKRRINSSEPPRSAGAPALTTTYAYDEPGGSGGGGCCGGDGGGGAGNRPTSITLPSGKVTTIAYDGARRKLSETAGAGTPEAATTQYQYNDQGDLTRIVDPRGKQWDFQYDLRHRRVTAWTPIDRAQNSPGTFWRYDPAGNIDLEIRPDQRRTVHTHDLMNRLVSTKNANDEVTSFAYGGTAWGDGTPGAPLTSGDNLVRLTDARGKHTHFTYDLSDRKTAMIYPGGGGREEWTYDIPGQVATYRTRAGQAPR